MSPHHKAITAAIFAYIIWGAATPIFKLALFSVPPFSMAVIRFWFASLFLLSFSVLKRNKLTFERKDTTKVILAALFAVPINIGLYFWGLSLSNALNTAIISSKTPLITALAAVIFAKEKVSRTVIAGLVIAFIGGLIIIGRPFIDNNGEITTLIGNLLILLAAISWVAATLILRDISAKYNPLTITTIGFTLGFFTLVPFAFWESLNNPSWFAHLPFSAFFGIGYAVLFSSITAYSLFTFALKTISATVANAAAYVMPLIGVFLSWLLLGEKITTAFIFGAGLIVIGMFLAETRHPTHPLHKHIHKWSPTD